MNLTYSVLAAVDLTGMFVNILILRTFFKEKTKNKFLQRSRMFVIWQVVCQTTILVMDAVESWNGIDIQPRESCDVVGVLSIIVWNIQGCNLTLIMIIYVDHYMACDNHFKVKIGVAVSWGISGSLITWWYSCGSQEILPRMAFGVTCVAYAVMPVYLPYATCRNNIESASESITPEASTKASPSMLINLKDDRKLISFIGLLLTAFVLNLSDLPYLSVYFKETFCLLIARLGAGFFLPLIVIGMIQSIHEEENRRKVAII